MTNEQLDKFKQIIYDPYVEAWELMKKMRDTEPKDDKFWEWYVAQTDDFKAKYPSEIGGSIYRLLLDAGSEVSRILKGANKNET